MLQAYMAPLDSLFVKPAIRFIPRCFTKPSTILAFAAEPALRAPGACESLISRFQSTGMTIPPLSHCRELPQLILHGIDPCDFLRAQMKSRNLSWLPAWQLQAEIDPDSSPGL